MDANYSKRSHRTRKGRHISLAIFTGLTTTSLLVGTGTYSAIAARRPSAAHLAAQYLGDLRPANAVIAKAETALRALPPSATTAQVEAVLGPLKKQLRALEATFGDPTTSSSSAGNTLARLGPPTVVQFEHSAQPTRSYPAPWGRWLDSAVNPCFIGRASTSLTMAGTRYEGVQLLGHTCGSGDVLYEVTWHFGAALSFNADIGLDVTSPTSAVTMGFATVVGTLNDPTAWKAMRFTADGTPVTSGAVSLASGVPTPVKVNLTGTHMLTLLLLVDGSSPVIDIANGDFVA